MRIMKHSIDDDVNINVDVNLNLKIESEGINDVLTTAKDCSLTLMFAGAALHLIKKLG